MTIPWTPQPVADATTALSPAIAGGGFTRLNPADGLFLRAEHLDTIGQYASDLAAAVGAGVGLGVVFGFTCRLSETNDAVYATGGLAIAAGQPLRSTAMTMVSLNDLHPQADDFWVVEIVPATWEYGSEPVYGSLCEDPCGRGSGIQPYAAEGVELKLRHDSLKGFGGVEPSLQRNWLASNYFERERKYGGTSARSANAPWLLPASPVEDITRHPWSEGTGHHDQAAVPLGVVWKRDGKWHLDVWTARRDCGEPTPGAAWGWRLGCRPRSVFIAQILQFQSQLQQADLSPLYALGFEELPPAGYLPWGFEDVDDDAVKEAAQTLFGPEVHVRVRRCRADFVAHAVEQVQHMDRIPLRGHVAGNPKVDLLVPSEPSDLKFTWTDSYGWSAFVRRREVRDDVPLPTAGPNPYTPLLAAIIGLLIGASSPASNSDGDGGCGTDSCDSDDSRDNHDERGADEYDSGAGRASGRASVVYPFAREAQPAKPRKKAATKGWTGKFGVAPKMKPPDLSETKPAEGAEAQSAELAKKTPTKVQTPKPATTSAAKRSGPAGTKSAATAKKTPTKVQTPKPAATSAGRRSGPAGTKSAATAKKTPTKTEGPTRK